MTKSTGIQKERTELRERGLKKCIDCAQVKALSEFYVASRNGSHQPNCKPCGTKRVAKWKAANPERAKKMYRASHIKKAYGLTPEAYDKMYAEQKGACAICRTHSSELPRGLAIDHDHETNEVRGLLCHECNAGIGMLGDDPVNIKSALEYLVRHGAL
jgi:hypothetical protein